jgi:hypothetical protein
MGSEASCSAFHDPEYWKGTSVTDEDRVSPYRRARKGVLSVLAHGKTPFLFVSRAPHAKKERSAAGRALFS